MSQDTPTTSVSSRPRLTRAKPLHASSSSIVSSTTPADDIPTRCLNAVEAIHNVFIEAFRIIGDIEASWNATPPHLTLTTSDGKTIIITGYPAWSSRINLFLRTAQVNGANEFPITRIILEILSHPAAKIIYLRREMQQTCHALTILETEIHKELVWWEGMMYLQNEKDINETTMAYLERQLPRPNPSRLNRILGVIDQFATCCRTSNEPMIKGEPEGIENPAFQPEVRVQVVKYSHEDNLALKRLYSIPSQTSGQDDLKERGNLRTSLINIPGWAEEVLRDTENPNAKQFNSCLEKMSDFNDYLLTTTKHIDIPMDDLNLIELDNYRRGFERLMLETLQSLRSIDQLLFGCLPHLYSQRSEDKIKGAVRLLKDFSTLRDTLMTTLFEPGKAHEIQSRISTLKTHYKLELRRAVDTTETVNNECFEMKMLWIFCRTKINSSPNP